MPGQGLRHSDARCRRRLTPLGAGQFLREFCERPTCVIAFARILREAASSYAPRSHAAPGRLRVDRASVPRGAPAHAGLLTDTRAVCERRQLDASGNEPFPQAGLRADEAVISYDTTERAGTPACVPARLSCGVPRHRSGVGGGAPLRHRRWTWGLLLHVAQTEA
jgi:hypothetical protein